ncbi:MAG: hypothetical protein QNJ46_21205 [Leptolyngbyaceae cyanobacterium MO_188.B28]|nr:hypothetical protein [Leptolyngbyaceae cyanobacterium MO_188.B28]
MLKARGYFFSLLCIVSFLLFLGCKSTAAIGCILPSGSNQAPTVNPTLPTQSSSMSLTIELPESLPTDGCIVEITFEELPESSYLGKVYFNPPEAGNLDYYMVKRFAIYGGGEGMAREQPTLIISIPGELIQRTQLRGVNRLVIIPEDVLGNPIENHGLVVADISIKQL